MKNIEQNSVESILALPAPGQSSFIDSSIVTEILIKNDMMEKNGYDSDIVGKSLEEHDALMLLNSEKELFFPHLEELYGIQFERKLSLTDARSFTSQKGIVRDVNGNKYFLKQKPEYCLSQEQVDRSVKLQSHLSKHLSFVPPIIPTVFNEPHAKIGSKTFLLTPYVEGRYYSGTTEESMECASTLALMHNSANEMSEINLNVLNPQQEAIEFIKIVEQLPFADKLLHKKITNQLLSYVEGIAPSRTTPIGWLHGDFAPFNIVFSRNGNIIAVNDFDNVAVGPVSRDVSECLLTHCAINYAGATSSMRAPIRTTIDYERMQSMVNAYREHRDVNVREITYNISTLWIELISLGLIRGDFSLRDVEVSFPFFQTLYECTQELV